MRTWSRIAKMKLNKKERAGESLHVSTWLEQWYECVAHYTSSKPGLQHSEITCLSSLCRQKNQSWCAHWQCVRISYHNYVPISGMVIYIYSLFSQPGRRGHYSDRDAGKMTEKPDKIYKFFYTPKRPIYCGPLQPPTRWIQDNGACSKRLTSI